MTPDLDPERRLALAYVAPARRPAIAALWGLDVALGKVLATGTDPTISRIRLAWWRESLEKLDVAPPPAEPVLQAVARQVLQAGVTGAELAEMEQGWATLAGPGPLTEDDLADYARERGGLLFAYSARLLGEPAIEVRSAGEGWALVDLARRSGDPAEARSALAAAHGTPLGDWPRALRPLGMLAVLARRDVGRGAEQFERQGSPGRMLRMLRHRLTGR